MNNLIQLQKTILAMPAQAGSTTEPIIYVIGESSEEEIQSLAETASKVFWFSPDTITLGDGIDKISRLGRLELHDCYILSIDAHING